MGKTKRPTFDQFKNQAFSEQKFNKVYSKLQPEFDLASQIVIARRKSKLSQSELAVILHTKQPAVARFENGGFTKSSIERLQEYVGALGYDLHINLTPKNNDSQHISN